MKRSLAGLAIVALGCAPRDGSSPDLARLEKLAAQVTITRDDWGIAHVRGKTDADAVFGVTYAQAEDDFNRVEMNYLNALGRTAEALGESEVYRDLRIRLVTDPDTLKALYGRSPSWLQALMTAWADGLNYYLATHPSVTPKVIRTFEPWMPLAFSEGSIGWDIERVSLEQLQAFYQGPAPKEVAVRAPFPPPEPAGSNGIAIGPSLTQSGAAMLLINPHTSFFFRAEAQMSSDEGLDAYGAITWGQFFVYQGFNDHVGWMHTSSGVDAVDEYAETVVETPAGPRYRYGTEERSFQAVPVTINYSTPSGLAKKTFTVYRSHHGPVVRAAGGKWITIKLMQDPIRALTESYSRTKARDYQSFKQTVELATNSSNNTVYADRDGTIAFFEASFIPKRDPSFDWSKPVDGSNPATEWKGLHPVAEHPNLENPRTGWIQNTNNSPWTAAGPASPRPADFPPYLDRVGDNPRGIHAVRLLSTAKGLTVDSFIALAYDSYLTAFDPILPPLLAAYRNLPGSSPLKSKLAEPIAALTAWDKRWSATSVPTSLAVYWGQELFRRIRAEAEAEQLSPYVYLATKVSPTVRLEALAAAVDTLVADFGSWKTPWGEINRFQRLNGDIVQPFNDAGPSLPVEFTSAQWGSLASFGARTYPGTKRMYGTSGNSFVAVVEFGKDRVRAKAVTAGGLSSDPKSKHFGDQAERYATGRLRDVYFERKDLEGHVEREYRPGK